MGEPQSRSELCGQGEKEPLASAGNRTRVVQSVAKHTALKAGSLSVTENLTSPDQLATGVCFRRSFSRIEMHGHLPMCLYAFIFAYIIDFFLVSLWDFPTTFALTTKRTSTFYGPSACKSEPNALPPPLPQVLGRLRRTEAETV